MNIGRHPGAHLALGVIESNFNAEDLFDSLTDCLNVARREFCLASDLFDDSPKIFAGLGIDAH